MQNSHYTKQRGMLLDIHDFRYMAFSPSVLEYLGPEVHQCWQCKICHLPYFH